MTCALVALSLLGGCSKDDPPPHELPTTAATSDGAASPSPTVTEPALPEAAKVYDQPGAEAFVRHYFDLVNYGQATGDSQPMRLLAGPECVVCTDFADQIDDVYRGGGSMRGGEFTLASVVAPSLNESPQAALVSVVFAQEAAVMVSPDGAETNEDARPEKDAGVVMTHDDNGWIIVGIGDL